MLTRLGLLWTKLVSFQNLRNTRTLRFIKIDYDFVFSAFMKQIQFHLLTIVFTTKSLIKGIIL